MWVVYRKTGSGVVFVGEQVSETPYIKQAEQFDSRSDAVAAASVHRMLTRERWEAARWKEAVRW